MKKILSMMLVLGMAVSMLTACGSKTYEIALITDKGNIDDKSFNQGSWEGVVNFTKEHKTSHQYYKPEDASNDGYLAAIDLAVTGGAKVVVTPGYLFEVPIYEAQVKYPDVKFVLLDGEPHDAKYEDYKTEKNVVSVMYAEEESGYLAGYAAVKDGYRNLGFMGGMALPAVQAFGYGYLQGIEAAAAELGLTSSDIKVTYHYTGNFEENDTNKATAKAMYQEGTEIIFACGGSVGKSVMAAATEAGKKVIGVDSDQRYDSETVVTSAMKGLAASVEQVLESIYVTNDFDSKFAGQKVYFNASNDGVGLPTVVIGDDKADAFDRFNSFNADDYKALYATLVDGVVDPVRTITIADTTGVATADELVSGLGLTNVAVEVR